MDLRHRSRSGNEPVNGRRCNNHHPDFDIILPHTKAVHGRDCYYWLERIIPEKTTEMFS
jgi:hypothetical protein